MWQRLLHERRLLPPHGLEFCLGCSLQDHRSDPAHRDQPNAALITHPSSLFETERSGHAPARNPHRPTPLPAQTPPRFPPSRRFGRLPPRIPSRRRPTGRPKTLNGSGFVCTDTKLPSTARQQAVVVRPPLVADVQRRARLFAKHGQADSETSSNAITTGGSRPRRARRRP